MIAMTNSNWRQQWQTTTHPISRRLDTRVCFDRILNFYYVKLISYRHLGAGAVIDYHVIQNKEDITVSHRYMDRLLGLDTSAKTVTVEPGMKVTSPFLTASKWAGPAWAVAELAWGRVSSVSRSILASHWLL